MFTCADRTEEAEPRRTPKATEPGRQTGAPNIGDLFLHEDKDLGFDESVLDFFLLCPHAREKLVCRLLLTYLRRAGSVGGELDQPTIYSHTGTTGGRGSVSSNSDSVATGICGAIQQKK